MKNSYRILSLEASDIYKYEQENGVDVGYKLPEYKSHAFFSAVQKHIGFFVRYYQTRRGLSACLSQETCYSRQIRK